LKKTPSEGKKKKVGGVSPRSKKKSSWKEKPLTDRFKGKKKRGRSLYLRKKKKKRTLPPKREGGGNWPRELDRTKKERKKSR